MKKKLLVSAMVLALAGACLAGCGKKEAETEKEEQTHGDTH